MKSLHGLLRAIFADAEMACSVRLDRDLQTCISRSEHEGLSFLTITLPNFGDWFDRSLEEGKVLSQTAFKRGSKTAFPRFLSGLLALVFTTDGQARDVAEISPDAIMFIRQICRMFKKLRVNCTLERSNAAVEAYRTCDADVARARYKDDLYRSYSDIARIVCSNILSGFDPSRIVPSHGPGAVAERATTNSKYRKETWTERLDDVFGFSDFLLSNFRWIEEPGGPNHATSLLRIQNEPPVRVCLVPKTLKSPRVIAIEPTHMQYIQQGIMQWLVPRIESSRYTRGHVNFSDQRINGSLALRASLDRRLATLDMSEASDRVSIRHLTKLLSVNPLFLKSVLACRSKSALLPTGEVIRLRKFASMGSALCFPIESLVFFCGILASLFRATGRRITPKNVYALSRDVYVYGDDLVVPAERAETIIEDLESLGFKVNRNKSFYRGSFRESCGVDAFNGYRITPIYVRELFTDGRSSKVLGSWVSLRNQLYLAGFWTAATFVQKSVEDTYGALPYVQPTSPGLGWQSFRGYSIEKWDGKLHRPLVRTYKLQPVYRQDPLDGHPALMKFFLSSSEDRDVLHLKRSVVRNATKIKRCWVTPF